MRPLIEINEVFEWGLVTQPHLHSFVDVKMRQEAARHMADGRASDQVEANPSLAPPFLGGGSAPELHSTVNDRRRKFRAQRSLSTCLP